MFIAANLPACLRYTPEGGSSMVSATTPLWKQWLHQASSPHTALSVRDETAIALEGLRMPVQPGNETIHASGQTLASLPQLAA